MPQVRKQRCKYCFFHSDSPEMQDAASVENELWKMEMGRPMLCHTTAYDESGNGGFIGKYDGDRDPKGKPYPKNTKPHKVCKGWKEYSENPSGLINRMCELRKANPINT